VLWIIADFWRSSESSVWKKLFGNAGEVESSDGFLKI
jgi:hypothetical protein